METLDVKDRIWMIDYLVEFCQLNEMKVRFLSDKELKELYEQQKSIRATNESWKYCMDKAVKEDF